MKTTLLALCAGLALVAAAGATAARDTVKPGFVPGTWNGTGKISGKTGDGPMSEVWSGNVRFTLVVGSNRKAGGSGGWALTMKGSGPVGSTMTGSAVLRMSGAATDVRFAGTQKISGTVSDGVRTSAINFTRAVDGKLVITRAGACRVTGISPMGPGLTFTWSARLAGGGTCNA
jgi:hypothetical protein